MHPVSPVATRAARAAGFMSRSPSLSEVYPGSQRQPVRLRLLTLLPHTVQEIPMNTLVHCVYVLVSRCDNQFYIGTSSNLAARLYAHECGETKSTRRRRPFTLLFTEHFLSKTDALRREKYFK